MCVAGGFQTQSEEDANGMGGAEEDIIQVNSTLAQGASLTTIVWLSVLSIVLFLLIVANFRRWRMDYCSRSNKDIDDTVSVTSSTITDIHRYDTGPTICQVNQAYEEDNKSRKSSISDKQSDISITTSI